MPSTYHDLDWPQPINWRHPLNRGLRGWWLAAPERARSVSWIDLVANRVGTLTNMTPHSDWVSANRPGASKLCLDLDGTNDFVQFPNNSVFNPGGKATWSLWLWTNTAQTGRPVWIQDDSSGKTFSTYKWIVAYVSGSSTTINGYVRIGGTAYSAGATATLLGQWTHVLTTFDRTLGSARLKTYVNGSLAGSADAADGDIDAGADPELGRWEGNSALFTGRVADPQIWHRALTAVEVAQLYRESLAGYPSMLRRRRPVAKAPAASSLISLSDTGAGADTAPAIAASLAANDLAAALDSIEAAAALGAADSCAGSDDPACAIVAALADSCLGGDDLAGLQAVLSALLDGCLGADVVAGGVLISVADFSAGDDTAPQVSVSFAVSDAAVAADIVAALTAALSLTDSGAGLDVAAVITGEPGTRICTVTFQALETGSIEFAAVARDIEFCPRLRTIEFSTAC